MIDWDKIVITVGTEQQKNFITKMISEISFSDKEKFEIINDDLFGCRIGSGGAFINVISELYRPDEKMLVINCGGFSKRCVNYAVKGKLFCTFYYNGKKMTLLELLIEQTSKIARKIKSGAVVCCSDILIDLEKTDFDNFSFDNNVGFCIRSSIEACSRHGVFIGENNKNTARYAHKKSESWLRKNISSDFGLLDTGMAFLSDEFLTEISRLEKENNLLEMIKNNGIELNLYPEIISLLAEKKEKEIYFYEDLQGNSHLKIRQLLWDAFSSMRIRIFEISADKFLHFGTVSESADNIRYLSGNKDIIKINSIVNSNCVVGDKTILENCYLNNCTVGRNVFISDIMLSDVNIPDNTLVCGIKTTDGKCAAVCCPIDENPKETVNNTELWKTARFSLAETFTESFNRFYKKSDDAGLVSMAWATENALADYYREWPDFLQNLNYCNASEKYISRSSEIIKKYFDSLNTVSELNFEKDFNELRLPLRLNLSGTWTDALPYCIDNGGEVINMSVKIDDSLPVYISLQKLDEPIIKFISDDKELTCGISDTDNFSDEFDDFILHKSVLKVMGITSKTHLNHGFCLKTRVHGIKKGSGLGVSSILLLGCFTVFERSLGMTFGISQKVNMVFVAEQVMKTGGGWQDQICGLSYGINITSAEAGLNQEVNIKKISDSDNLKRLINERFAVVYTGQRHYGRFIVYEIMNKYLDSDLKVCEALHNLKKLNSPMEKAIFNEDIKEIAALLNRQFDLLKELSDNITNDQIDSLAAQCRGFADGVCICGAGAGGYLMLVLKDGTSFEALKENLRRSYHDNSDIAVSRVSLYEE